MRLGIIADTHNHLDLVQRAVAEFRERRIEVLIHCGDVTTAPIVEALAGWPAYYVYGNNDANRLHELEQAFAKVGATSLHWGGCIELAGKKLGVSHGHLQREMHRLRGQELDYLFYGHTHEARDEHHGATRCVNPGGVPRGSGPWEQFSVATLDLTTDTLEFVPIPPVAGGPNR